jgi:hypothetical protein
MASPLYELGRAKLLELCDLPPDIVDDLPRSCKTINLRKFEVDDEQGNGYYASLDEWETAPDLPLSIAVMLAFTDSDVAVLHDGDAYVVLVKKT